MTRIAAIFLGLAILSGCDPGGVEPIVPGDVWPELNRCSIQVEDVVSASLGRDIIPALTDPAFVSPENITYLAGEDRVIGLVVDGEAYAVPHNILWFHEIVNLNLPSVQLAVTYAPLTGSSLAFNRAAIGGGEFGVSGLLYLNNLMMYDRTSNESLWSQMSRQADCGPRLGAQLTAHPVLDITWAGWQALHPETRVLSNRTGYGLGYTRFSYPYGNYEQLDNETLLYPMEVDDRRPLKERLLGIPDIRRGGIAFPFSELNKRGAVNAVHAVADLGPVVVFWDRAALSAMAYRPEIDGQPLSFEVSEDRILDAGTGSVWRVDGLAVEGALAGTQLEPIETAYISFWFAWAAFQPDTMIWEG